MDTTLMIKTNKKLRDDAKLVASELGVPLTTIVNALLKQFVREKKFSPLARTVLASWFTYYHLLTDLTNK